MDRLSRSHFSAEESFVGKHYFQFKPGFQPDTFSGPEPNSSPIRKRRLNKLSNLTIRERENFNAQINMKV